MKSWFESLLIALSMYSTLPVKCLNWTPRNLRHAMACFPLVGLLCGAALAMLIWKRKQENRPEEIDEENMEDFAE